MIEAVNTMKGVCTMETGKPLCNILNGKWVKYPSLAELYKYLFEINMEVKHEALYDTQKCLECYVELRKRIKKNQWPTKRYKTEHLQNEQDKHSDVYKKNLEIKELRDKLLKLKIPPKPHFYFYYAWL